MCRQWLGPAKHASRCTRCVFWHPCFTCACTRRLLWYGLGTVSRPCCAPCHFGLSYVWMPSSQAKSGRSELRIAELISNIVCLHHPVDACKSTPSIGRLHHASLWKQIDQSAKGNKCALTCLCPPCHPLASPPLPFLCSQRFGSVLSYLVSTAALCNGIESSLLLSTLEQHTTYTGIPITWISAPAALNLYLISSVNTLLD